MNHRLLYKWTVHGNSNSITTELNTVQNKSKLIGLLMRVELIQAILMSRLTDFF